MQATFLPLAPGILPPRGDFFLLASPSPCSLHPLWFFSFSFLAPPLPARHQWLLACYHRGSDALPQADLSQPKFPLSSAGRLLWGCFKQHDSLLRARISCGGFAPLEDFHFLAALCPSGVQGQGLCVP